MIEPGTFKEWITRPVHSLPWHTVHVNLWQAHQWRQVFEAVMVVDDFGDLVAVQYTQTATNKRI